MSSTYLLPVPLHNYLVAALSKSLQYSTRIDVVLLYGILDCFVFDQTMVGYSYDHVQMELWPYDEHYNYSKSSTVWLVWFCGVYYGAMVWWYYGMMLWWNDSMMIWWYDGMMVWWYDVMMEW